MGQMAVPPSFSVVEKGRPAAAAPQQAAVVLPPKREVRAVWIATVENIDWPRRGDYEPASQQRHFRDLLDKHRSYGINSVFVQVRDAADAYYARGATEPWSKFLTGQQGRAPQPFYDPLDFMIQEAHARDMEFHAWLNLNRAVLRGATGLTPNHISHRHPEWMLSYDGMKLFDMGIPAVRDYITGIVTNLVRNYDIDGIHFDDYFYPYHVPGQRLNDQATFRQFGQGFSDIGDWRRHNIDALIEQISDSIRSIKPYVKFGISPFSVWRNQSTAAPDGSPTYNATASYDDLYADTRKWLKMGWIDYLAPQAYLERSHAKVPYEPLVDWWRQNCFGRHLYIGQGAYRVGQALGGFPLDELMAQLNCNRRHPEVQGSIFFSSRSITELNPALQDSLRKHFYAVPSFIPAMPWKDAVPPLPPRAIQVRQQDEVVEVSWTAPGPAADGERPARYVVYRFDDRQPLDLSNPLYIIATLPAKQTYFTDAPPAPGNYRYVITGMDRLHNESDGLLSPGISLR